MARTKADPIAMVGAWREIGRMCGFYEPTRTEVKVSVDGQVVLQQLQSMSDDDLLKLISEESEANKLALEGEFEEVLDDGDSESDE